MRRVEVEYRPEAYSDIERIYFSILYVSQSVQTADRFIRRFFERCDSIGNAPHGGKRCGPPVLNLRMVPFERSAIIVYHETTALVEIVRVFSSRSDYLKILADMREDSA